MKKGFTIIELVVVIVLLGAAVAFFFVQKLSFDAAARDNERKIAINAMYFNLEEAFYPEHGYYPAEIGEDNLRAMDPQLFTDPFGYNVGDADSDYRYEPTGCAEDQCTGYTLRAQMEREDEFVRNNR